MTTPAAAAPKVKFDIPDYVTAPLTTDEKERRMTMREAWKAYRGQFVPPLKKRDGKTAAPENTMVNRCAPIIDKGVSFLFGQVVKVEGKELTQAEAEYIASCWGDDDDMMSMLAKVAMNGGVCGQSFVRILEPNDDDDFPRIVNLDPQTVTVITDDDDCETVLAYLIEYSIPQRTGMPLTRRQAIWRIDPDGNAAADGGYCPDDTWMIQHLERIGENGSFQPVGDPILWPYPFSPIVDCQNLPNPNEFWGLSDLPPELIAINNSINFSKSNFNKILKHHAHPKTFFIGTEAGQISFGVDDAPCLPEGADMKMLEMHGDLKASMDFQRELRDDMDEQSRVPAVALGRLEALPKGNISGVALQLLFMPLLEKTTQKQRQYGRLIREVCRRVLALGGKAKYDPRMKIEVHWQALLPIDDLAAAQTAQILVSALGLSQDTALRDLGFDPDEQADLKAKEQQRQVTAFSRGQGMPPPPFGPQPGMPQLPPAGGTQQGDEGQ